MSDEPEQVIYWMGEPVADMPRERLLEIVHAMAGMIREFQSPFAIEERATGAAIMAVHRAKADQMPKSMRGIFSRWHHDYRTDWMP